MFAPRYLSRKIISFFLIFFSIAILQASEIKKHYIVNIKDEYIYIDYGKADKVREGEIYSLYKIEAMRHPVTKEIVEAKDIAIESVKIISVDERVSIVESSSGIPDKLKIGDQILLEPVVPGEQIITAPLPKNEIILLGKSVQYDKNDYYYQTELGYLYRFFTYFYSIKMGIGGIEGKSYKESDIVNTIDAAFYYGYVEGELNDPLDIGGLSAIMNLKIGLTKDGVRLGVSGIIRIKEEFQTHLLMGYAFYPVAGVSGFLEFNIAASEYVFPSLSITIEEIPPDVKKSVLFSIGFTLKAWEGLKLKIIGGFGGRSTARTGYNLNVMTKFTF